ncbi:MAG: glutamate--cysteine ligase [Castellaniella sp.]
MTSFSERLHRLGHHTSILRKIHRGIEKEGLRVGLADGRLSMTPHPQTLGCALTHSRITTDYSEALLELVTGTHTGVEPLMQELEDIHRFVTANLAGELIWNQSMPARLPAHDDIPVAWYGHSNSAMLKHVYRLGLAERYGKPMQCIAGIHYNFSLPDHFWDKIGTEGDTEQERRSTGYMALIRNFMRHAWLLMYLFGASPAVSRDFFARVPDTILTLDDDTLYLPHATSLRMSDIGYHNKAQSELQLCYNDLDTFLARIYTAVTTPWPDYEAIGTHRDGQWIQLNTNILQIENEYYSSIRPKRVTGRCERPATALMLRGIEYVEVRCMDIDPFTPAGIDAETCRFLDAFMLFCALEDSPHFPDGGYCQDSRDNFDLVSSQGRRPSLRLKREDEEISLRGWAEDILQRMQPYAAMLDQANASQAWTAALQAQECKVDDNTTTPSARLLQALRDSGESLNAFTLRQSLAHREALLANPLDAAQKHHFDEEAAASCKAQQALEAEDDESFDEYVARFHEALTPVRMPAVMKP